MGCFTKVPKAACCRPISGSGHPSTRLKIINAWNISYESDLEAGRRTQKFRPQPIEVGNKPRAPDRPLETCVQKFHRSRCVRFGMDSLQWSKMKNVARTALVLALGFLVGCSNSSNPAMTGSWFFAFTPLDSSTVVLQFTANLTQEGSQITGQASLTGDAAACGTAGSMQGSLMGNTLTLEFNQLQSTINLNGTVNPEFTSASGTYTGASGSCLLNGGIGSWSAVLQ